MWNLFPFSLGKPRKIFFPVGWIWSQTFWFTELIWTVSFEVNTYWNQYPFAAALLYVSYAYSLLQASVSQSNSLFQWDGWYFISHMTCLLSERLQFGHMEIFHCENAEIYYFLISTLEFFKITQQNKWEFQFLFPFEMKECMTISLVSNIWWSDFHSDQAWLERISHPTSTN